MKSFNCVQILGNVGFVGETKIFENGGKSVTISVATSRGGYTAKDGTTIPEKTTWHAVVCSNALADVVQKYVNKGDCIFIAGEPQTREYLAQNGERRVVTEVRASDIVLCGGRGTQDDNMQPVKDVQKFPPKTAAKPQTPPVKNEDLPF